MVFKWGDKYTERFLNLYRKNECLWNTRNASNRDRDVREAAYANICQSMNIPGLTVADIKNKIKIIRTVYKNELNKILKSARNNSDVSDIYVPKLTWFNTADEFLRSACVLRVVDDVQTVDIEEEKKVPEKDETHFVIMEEPPYNPCHIPLNNTPVPDIEEAISLESPPKKVSRKRARLAEAVEESIQTLQKLSDICKEEDEEDEFDIFSRCMAMHLRKLPLERALSCQQTIMAFINQERMNVLNPELPSYNGINHAELCDIEWEHNTKPTVAELHSYSKGKRF